MNKNLAVALAIIGCSLIYGIYLIFIQAQPAYTAYQEIEELSSGRVMGFYVQNKDTGEKIQMASDISDVRYSFSLEDAIVQLVDFDDNKPLI